MKLSVGVEWALHCCVVLTTATEPVPAARLAELHDVSASYLAKQLQALSRVGLVSSVQGKAGGYVLTRAPEVITVLDVVAAVDGSQPAFVCTEIRQRGPLATPKEACVRHVQLPGRWPAPTPPGMRPCKRYPSRTSPGLSTRTTALLLSQAGPAAVVGAQRLGEGRPADRAAPARASGAL